MNILILDDDPARHKTFTERNIFGARIFRAFSAREAIAHLQDWQFDFVFLDHDLDDFQNNAGYMIGAGNGTGMDVARFIANMSDKPKFICIHSWNEEAAKKMFELIGGLIAEFEF